MPGHDIIVVGASAGGVEALARLLPALNPDIPAAIFVVLHIPSQSPSLLPQIFNRSLKKHQLNSRLQAVHPTDGEEIQSGRIYVAPPDKHLLIKDGHIRLARGPRENNHRPAIDPFFRSAARAYGQRVVGVVLSGTLDDGTAGLLVVKQQGGVAIVQDPEDALYDGMPRSAIENVEVDRILGITEMAPVLLELAQQPVEEGVSPMSSDMEMEADMAELELGAMQNSDRPGTPSPFACPDCGGVLWELHDDNLLRFRCRTGHAFSTGTLLSQQSEALEEALWTALRALEEKAALSQRLGKQAQQRDRPYSAKRFGEQAEVAQQQATLVRQLLLNGNGKGMSTVNGKLVETSELTSMLSQDKSNPSSQIVEEMPQRSGAPPITNTPNLDLVAICASAGGLNAIIQVLSALPADFPAAITVVQHLSPHHPSAMAGILSRRISLGVKQAEQGDYLQPGTVYLAPPNQHLLVNPDGTLSLSNSELVHFVRPSADLLFESVAASFRHRAIAVVLTGSGMDGAMGVRAIKQMGGITIAQNQESCEFFGMPEAAIDTGAVDRIVPLPEIAATLVNLLTKQDREIFES